MEQAFWNENDYKSQFQTRLLTLLIKKYESSKSFVTGEPSKQRPRIVMRISPFQADYEDEMDFRKREWMHEVILELNRMGIVEYEWAKFQEGREIAKVRLVPDRVSLAYDLAGIEPREQKLEKLGEILSPLLHHPWAWVAEWAALSVQALRERKTSGLDLDDLDGYRLLVQVLAELPKLEDEVSKRILSQRLFQDTKIFERAVERRLVHLIQSYSGLEYESDKDALASVGIADHPDYVMISGQVHVLLGDGQAVSLGVFHGGVGLSRDTVRRLEITGLPVERIIMIENLTSWHRWVAERKEAREVVIYTGGFPNRSVQRLFKKIADYLSQNNGKLPIYHWGDMDVGGIRIFEFIREHFFPELVPLWMDESSFVQYAGSGMAISRAYQNKIRELLADQRFAHWHGLLGLMLSHGKRVEQESLDMSLKEIDALE